MPSPTARPRSTSEDRTLNHAAFAAQRGDAAALAAILTRLRALLPLWVRSDSRRRGFSICEADVDEIVQKVLISVWSTDLARFDVGRGSFGGFIRRRARWTLIDHIRGLASTKGTQLPDTLPARRCDPQAILEDAERERFLLALPEVVGDVLNESMEAEADCEQPSRSAIGAAAIRGKDLDGETLRHVAAAMGRHPSALTRARQHMLLHLRSRLAPSAGAARYADWI